MKAFNIDGANYIIKSCSAICLEDGFQENKRQLALLVERNDGQEKQQFVVFNCWEENNLNSDEDFLDMCNDCAAWESDWRVLETVRI